MAQDRLVYLTTEDVKIDSLLPYVGYNIPLPENYQDSIYTISVLYPEYIDMSPADIAAYNHLSGEALPEIPQANSRVAFDRKRPFLCVGVQPLAFRDGRYRWLASFMLKIESKPKEGASRRRSKGLDEPIYAEHSVLATGKWAKIRVSSTGVHHLSEETIRKAGFNDINKVHIYGYGGNLQPERFSSDYLREYDDLHEVQQYVANGRHLFYGRGPVSWESATSGVRTRNPYSNYGYYFITQTDEAVEPVDSATFVNTFINDNDFCHALHEQDGHAWTHAGRNLYDPEELKQGAVKMYSLANNTGSTDGILTVSLSGRSASTVSIEINDSIVGQMVLSKAGDYDKGKVAQKSFRVSNLAADNQVRLIIQTGEQIRLDYISLTFNNPNRDVQLSSKTVRSAEFVYNITNQDHHADPQADMVIIIPTSQKTLSQATRLADMHRKRDGMTVNIVPADELYNEFASGTPDANAYRRYMKMLYDRATSEDDMPKHLLLFADGIWDNRLMTASGRGKSADDLLLCYESENSTSETDSYVDDNWFCLLDEGEGSNPQASDLPDIAVGRFPVSNAYEAKIMVDKTIRYAENANAGAWQNVIAYMGDDGNKNLHMTDVIAAADSVSRYYPGYLEKRFIWDAYERVTTATGNTYPKLASLIKQQQQNGALIMDYAGHGAAGQLSHEGVLHLVDFEQFSNENLPLWITASCDVMPFDSGDPNIGESAVLNERGGAVAFFGTTRTVYANYNKHINIAYLKYVLSNVDGKQTTLGEAQRLTKRHLVINSLDRTNNKLQYQLLGDPALRLNAPTLHTVIDAINGVEVGKGEMPRMKAGGIATISGHIENRPDFAGRVTVVINDSEEDIYCRMNDQGKDGTDKQFVYKDRPKTIYNGTGVVKDGAFEISFTVPMDINYSDASGLITSFAVSDDKTQWAHGVCDQFIIGGTETVANDSIGPSIYCYLNSPSFVNGDKVNSTPYFVARINDEDGINTTGAGIGHDLILTIDGEMSRTYNLNDNFAFDEGSSKAGQTAFSIPQLSEGKHTLQFRAWDIFNNSSVATLNFEVVNALQPTLTSISCTDNPARTETTFIISHDRMGSELDIVIDVMDMSGRQLWQHHERGVGSGSSYTVKWDLTMDDGQQLQTGVYLYRARISTENSDYDSKAKKLIVIR